MALWPFGRGGRSVRAAAGQQAPPDNYTDRVVATFEALAAGGISDPAKLAATEFAAGLLARSLSRATVAAGPGVRAAVTGHLLAMIGRALVRRGELLAVVDVSPMSGALALYVAGTWDVRGGWHPATWRYRADLFGPSGNITRLLPADAVTHFRWNVDPERPWHGQPAIHVAAATAGTASNAERSLTRESKVPVARVAVVPHPAADERAVFEQKLAAGGLVTTAGGAFPVGDRGAEPSQHWKPAAMGPAPARELVELRRDSARELCEAIGVPAALFVPGSTEGAQRAAWRRYLAGTVEPAAEMIAAELSDKLEQPVALDVAMLATPDAVTSTARAVNSRASAYSTLRGAGMGDAEARALAGL